MRSLLNIRGVSWIERNNLSAHNASVDDARVAFSETLARPHPRLLAIIITQNGKRTEQPLGIITPWDLLQEPVPA